MRGPRSRRTPISTSKRSPERTIGGLHAATWGRNRPVRRRRRRTIRTHPPRLRAAPRGANLQGDADAVAVAPQRAARQGRRLADHRAGAGRFVRPVFLVGLFGHLPTAASPDRGAERRVQPQTRRRADPVHGDGSPHSVVGSRGAHSQGAHGGRQDGGGSVDLVVAARLHQQPDIAGPTADRQSV